MTDRYGRTSVTQNKSWCTPKAYIPRIEGFLGGIGLDPCWHPASAVRASKVYVLPEHDGLREPWDRTTIYVNPPYGYDKARGTHISDWLRRCAEASRAGSEVLALVPVATNTAHWEAFVFGVCGAICFLREPRVKFEGMPSNKGAPMACAMVYWGDRLEAFRQQFEPLGSVVFPLKRALESGPDTEFYCT